METKRKTTLADIAREAGVSCATASRILNDRLAHQFAAATRREVRGIAERLGYRGHLAGRGLTARHTAALPACVTVLNSGPLGWDMKDPANFFTQTLHGIMREAEAHQFTVNLAGNLGSAHAKIRALDGIADGSTAGVLSCGLIEPAVVRYLLDRRLPVVHMGDGLIPDGIPVVHSDNWSGGLLAAQHLLSLGHRRLVFVGEPQDPACRFYGQRLAGFVSGILTAGLPVDNTLTLMSARNGLPAALARLMGGPRPPSGFFGGVQSDALDVLDWLTRHRMAVPRQVSVIGFDNFPSSETATPPLTTIDVPRKRIGMTAFRLLLRAAQDPESAEVTTLVPVRLVVRRSTGPCLALP